MPEGLTPARGPWEYRRFNTDSAATYAKGCLVMLNGARNVVEFTSASTQYLGIAMSHSTASLPAGKVMVALPADNCTAYADLLAGIGTSELSFGEAGCIQKSGNLMSYYTNQTASVFSVIAQIVGPVDSDSSRVEVAFVKANAAFYSASSVTIA